MSDEKEISPMDDTENYWHVATHDPFFYSSYKSGKWILFVPYNKINDSWDVIRQSTLNGELGPASKVSTARRNDRQVDATEGVICVYTWDYADTKDLDRVLLRIRELGFTQPIKYKKDSATLEGVYGKNSFFREEPAVPDRT